MGPHARGAYDQFFLEPNSAWHRRYEALRAVFVEEEPLREVAQQFGVNYGTLRNWTSEFRAACDLGQAAPFFSRRRTDH
jgi:transposase